MAGIIRRALAGGGAALEVSGLKILQSELDEMRQTRLQELQSKSAKELQQSGFEHDRQMVDVREAARRAGEEFDVTNIEPIRTDIAVDRTKKSTQARIDIETSPENIQKEIDKLNALEPAKAAIRRKELIADLAAKATPEALDAAAKIARATHIESASSVAQADLAKKQGKVLGLSIADKERLTKLQDEFLNPNTSKERKEQITTEMNVLQGKREDVIKMRVKVGENTDGTPIMEDVLVDPKSKKRIDVGGGSAPAGAPPIGAVVGDFKFKGGNPKDRNNWEPKNPVFGGSGEFKRDTTKTDITKSSSSKPPITDLSAWVREKTSGLIGGYRYKNKQTGETISASEFDARTR